MATDRRAEVTWQGSLMEGSGRIDSTTSGVLGQQRDQRQVEHEDGDAHEPLDQHEPAAGADRDELVDEERRADLEEQQREADRDREREHELPLRELGLHLPVGVLLLRGVVGRDRERPEADRERLAERDDAADDGQPVEAVPRHRRDDRLRDLRDLPVGLADGDGPVAGAAHHHALQDRLAADRRGHGSASTGGAAGLLEPPLEALDPAARVHELLLARVEGVAFGADLHVQLRLGRTGRELVAARAAHVRDDVLGMDVRLHGPTRIAVRSTPSFCARRGASATVFRPGSLCP